MGPPPKETGPSAHQPRGTANTPHMTSHRQTAGYCHPNVGIPLRRPADLFREGFRRGAVDALRLAMREIDDPAVWRVLTELANRYELAGGDS